jgi:hypothetical protein
MYHLPVNPGQMLMIMHGPPSQRASSGRGHRLAGTRNTRDTAGRIALNCSAAQSNLMARCWTHCRRAPRSWSRGEASGWGGWGSDSEGQAGLGEAAVDGGGGGVFCSELRKKLLGQWECWRGPTACHIALDCRRILSVGDLARMTLSDSAIRLLS